jgi:opacity protein-like surface antigen
MRFAFIIAAGCVLAVAPAAAQRVETSASIGYSWSEGISGDDRLVNGQIYNEGGLDSGTSWNFTIGGFVTERVQLEFLYGRQSSLFNVSGPNARRDIADLNIDHYMGNVVYNWGEASSRMRPYILFGMGATNYGFGDLIDADPVVNPLAPTNIESKTKFSTTWGGGVKYYFSPNVGAKVGARWTPTFINSTDEGVWCDYWYGCWVIQDMQYSHQFETSVGITVRF